MQDKIPMGNFIYTSEEFGLRLAMLREQRHISARQMSLDMGQNKNYINSIESGNNYPTMGNFFDICLYLKITPEKFFEGGEQPPLSFEDFVDLIFHLPREARDHLYLFLTGLKNEEEPPCF